MSYLPDFNEFNRGYVTFGGGAKGGKITGKGTLKTGKLDFEDLADESQVLLKVPRKNNMYSVDMKNIFPKESLTCLVAKATLDESILWYRRLGELLILATFALYEMVLLPLFSVDGARKGLRSIQGGMSSQALAPTDSNLVAGAWNLNDAAGGIYTILKEASDLKAKKKQRTEIKDEDTYFRRSRIA
ncbi:hypothetical protein Tco_1043555 [Tanacetum coccineum]|uniref:Uncharacterized protein n=1 Tax=Tanacetum coccineum TaxID=301880 RepID=A0ABQ5GNK4_9ASTR